MQRGGKIAIEEFTQVLGSGGFGLILAEPKGERVVKLYYDSGACKEMNEEFEMLQRVYEAFQAYPVPQVTVPRGMQVDNEKFTYSGREILCGIEMTRLHALPIMRDKTNPIIHIILKQSIENSGMINKEAARIYSEPIGKDNPSRGFFAGANYIRDVILPSLTEEQKGVLTTVDAIAETIGKIFAVILGIAGIIPNDVEYCLVLENNLLKIAVLDFGMAIPFPIDITKDELVKTILTGSNKYQRATGVEYDLYFPDRDSPLFAAFERGMISVLESGDLPKKEVLANVIRRYNN